MMSFASMGRRCALRSALAFTAFTLQWQRSSADAAAVAPIRELCDSLLGVMRAGRGTPFPRRFAMLAPAIERALDLAAILQLSVGPPWSSLPAADQNTLLTAFSRYTIANYVNSFDNYTGQRFDVQPDTRALPNGEQVVQTKI